MLVKICNYFNCTFDDIVEIIPAQRIEQIAWMLFLKVYDSHESGISNGTSSAMLTGSLLPIFS
ncbi:MAG: hypothetical protein IJJ00_08280 [Erysipelotrichaceae bacterium]|nr:hypothetical protein [Erysipelotrichaceae bacterium]